MTEQLMRSVQAGRIVHALLFVGPHGTGKRTVADLFARAMLCRGENKPCGMCPPCKQYLSGTHPDVRVVSPQGKSIGVEDIRALIDYLSLKPYEGGKHIAIIEQADKMTPSAQNALLKTLESPTGDAAFFLLTDAPGALLSTILSRCQTVRFGELTPELCAQALVNHGVAPERAQVLAEVAQGSVGRALEIDADEGFFALKAKVLESLETLQKGPASVAQAAQMLEGEKENAAAVLEIMELCARDLMQAQNGGSLLQKSEADRIGRLKLNGGKLLEGVLGMKVRLAGNVQWISALEYMYFGLVA